MSSSSSAYWYRHCSLFFFRHNNSRFHSTKKSRRTSEGKFFFFHCTVSKRLCCLHFNSSFPFWSSSVIRRSFCSIQSSFFYCQSIRCPNDDSQYGRSDRGQWHQLEQFPHRESAQWRKWRTKPCCLLAFFFHQFTRFLHRHCSKLSTFSATTNFWTIFIDFATQWKASPFFRFWRFASISFHFLQCLFFSACMHCCSSFS